MTAVPEQTGDLPLELPGPHLPETQLPEARLPELPLLGVLADCVPGVLTRITESSGLVFDVVDVYALEVLADAFAQLRELLELEDPSLIAKTSLHQVTSLMERLDVVTKNLGPRQVSGPLVTLRRLVFELRLSLLGATALDGPAELDLLAVELCAFANAVRRHHLAGTDQLLHLFACRSPQDASWAWFCRTLASADRLSSRAGLL